MSEFTDTLRCHDDPRLYLEADILLCAAADNIDRVEAEIASLKQELQALREQKPVIGVYVEAVGHRQTYVLWSNLPKGNHDLYAAPVPASEWQSIETAPKDGTIICLGSMESDDFPAISTTGRWNSAEDDGVDYMGQDAGFVDIECNVYHCGRSFGNPARQYKGSHPTHWMPLPPPPPQKDQS